MNGKYLYVFILILLLSPDFTYGQSQAKMRDVSLNSFCLMPVLNPWLITDNPAGLSQNTILHPGEMNVGFFNESGNFKRVQQGDNMQHYRFETRQYKKIRKTSLYGSFSYDKSFEKGVNYTEVNDPYRGTPYLLIDTVKTTDDTYDREFLKFTGTFSTPLNDKISWGISTHFNVGLASQNRDPRPRNKVLRLSVSPGILFSVSKFHLGLNLVYGYYNEDIEAVIVRENTQMTFFSLHGLGTYVYHVAASYNRLYKQNSLGVNGQVSYRSGAVTSLLGVKFTFLKETTDDGRGEGNASWAHIKNCAELNGVSVNIVHSTVIHQELSLHNFLMNITLRQLLGTEIIQQLMNNPNENYMENWVTFGKDEKYGSYLLKARLSYRFIKLKEGYRTNYSLGGGASFLSSDQVYYLPNQEEKYKNLILLANFDKSFYFNKSILSVSAALRYKRNLSGMLNLTDSTFIVSKLTRPDFEYYTRNYFMPGMELSYEIPLKKIKSNYFIKTQIDFLRANDGRTRTFFNVRTGIIF